MELSELARDWKWLFDPGEFALVDVSPVGDLFLRDRTGAYCLLDVNMGKLEYAEFPGSDPSQPFPIAFDMKIAHGYIDAGKLPTEGECFGYRIPLVAGGSLDVENVYVATLTEYVSFLANFHEQIQDVVDGETVVLKAFQPKPN